MNPNTTPPAPPRPKNSDPTLWDPYRQGPAVRSVNVREVVKNEDGTVTVNPSVKQVRAALVAAKKQEFQRVDKKMRRDLKRAAGRAAGTRP